MFGINKRVERVRVALITALLARSTAVMQLHASKNPSEIPKHDLARALVLRDIADILTHLRVEQVPEEDGRP